MDTSEGRPSGDLRFPAASESPSPGRRDTVDYRRALAVKAARLASTIASTRAQTSSAGTLCPVRS